MVWGYDDCVVFYCVYDLYCIGVGVVDIRGGFYFGCCVYIVDYRSIWVFGVYFFDVFSSDGFCE